MLFTKTALTTKKTTDLTERVEQHLRDHKGKYIFQGVGFVASGVLAATLSSTTALHTELLVGVVLLLTGILQLVLTLKSKMHWWSFLSACLSIAIGTLILWKPFPVLISVVTLLAIFLTMEGVFELFLACRFRPVRSWNWMIFSGIITLSMGRRSVDWIPDIRCSLPWLDYRGKPCFIRIVLADAGLESRILKSHGKTLRRRRFLEHPSDNIDRAYRH